MLNLNFFLGKPEFSSLNLNFTSATPMKRAYYSVGEKQNQVEHVLLFTMLENLMLNYKIANTNNSKWKERTFNQFVAHTIAPGNVC